MNLALPGNLWKQCIVDAEQLACCGRCEAYLSSERPSNIGLPAVTVLCGRHIMS